MKLHQLNTVNWEEELMSMKAILRQPRMMKSQMKNMNTTATTHLLKLSKTPNHDGVDQQPVKSGATLGKVYEY